MPALKEFVIRRRFDPQMNRDAVCLVVWWGDNTHEYQKFYLPCDREAVLSGLRELADKIENIELWKAQHL